MRIFSHQEKSSLNLSSIVTIGNFDGVHLGHRALIENVVKEANSMALNSALVTFEPHPQEIINQGQSICRICTISHQLNLFEKLGLDEVHLIRFTKELSKMPPKEFVIKFLVNRFNLTKLIIGYDFHFGKQRSGDFKLLENLSKKFNFSVEEFAPVKEKGKIVSSTLIRGLIKKFNFEKIPYYLGREFSIYGKVVYGEKRGKKLGFPTANITPESPLAIKNGVYVSKIKLAEKIYYGVTNIGKKPTFGENSVNIETWIFEFDGDLYGKNLEVIPLCKLRPEKKFSSIKELKQQIGVDTLTAQNFLKEKNIFVVSN